MHRQWQLAGPAIRGHLQLTTLDLGKLTWLRVREQSKQALGDRFDIREFHDASLLSGAMRLTVLDAGGAGYVKNG